MSHVELEGEIRARKVVQHANEIRKARAMSYPGFPDAEKTLRKWEREEGRYRKWQLAFDLGFGLVAAATLFWWLT